MMTKMEFNKTSTSNDLDTKINPVRSFKQAKTSLIVCTGHFKWGKSVNEKNWGMLVVDITNIIMASYAMALFVSISYAWNMNFEQGPSSK